MKNDSLKRFLGVLLALAAVGCFLFLCRPWQRAGKEAGAL